MRATHAPPAVSHLPQQVLSNCTFPPRIAPYLCVLRVEEAIKYETRDNIKYHTQSGIHD